MTDLKKNYTKLKTWIESIDPKKIDFFRRASFYEEDFKKIQELIWLERNISESKDLDYILGDKTATLESISQHMLGILNEHLSRYTTENEEERYFEDESYGDYDSAGYYTKDAVGKIVEFFSNFDERKLFSIANGSYEDYYEVDLNGGRWYFIDRSVISEMIFNYLYYTKRQESFGDSIFNTTSLNEELEDFYSFRLEKINIPSNKEFNSVYRKYFIKEHQKNFDRYNSFIDDIIENFESDPMFSDLVGGIKKLRADDEYIKKKLENV